MNVKKLRGQEGLFVVVIIGCLILLNVLGLRAFGRFDLTSDHAYTLSKATREALGTLEDPITVKAYFTDKLPAPYSNNARYVRDLLEEFRSASKGKLSFEFLDPMEAETSADKAAKRDVKRDVFGRQFREPTSVEKELSEAGVQPVEIRVVEEDQVQTKRAYMGVVVNFGDKKEVIPVVQDLSSLEYDLTSLIRKLTRKRTPVIAVLQGHGEPKMDEKFRGLQTVLSQTYAVRPVDLGVSEKVAEDVDALLVLGPKTALKPNELKALDQFLMHGKSIGFFVDAVQVDARTFEGQPTDPGLATLLQSYGVTLGDKLVADVQAAQLNVQERRGFMTVSMPVPYPFIPHVLQLESDSPISKGISELSFPFPSQVSATGTSDRKAVVLARSSRKSWLESKPYKLDPRREWSQEQITPSGPYDLMVQMNGKFPSHYADEARTSHGGTPLLAESNSEARIVVAGTSALFQDDFMGRPNQALLLNVADWMMLDPAMLAMRTRGLSTASLTPDLSDAARSAAKWGNVLGIPFLLAMYGVTRWRMREGRRATVGV